MTRINKTTSVQYFIVIAAAAVSVHCSVLAEGAGTNWYTLFQAGQFSDAEKGMDAALNSDPNDAYAHYYRAVCRSKRSDWNAAADDFNWVMTHSVDPILRQSSDKALQSILHPQQVRQQAVAQPANQRTSSSQVQSYPGKSNQQPREEQIDQQKVDESKEKALTEESQILKEAQAKCNLIDSDAEARLKRIRDNLRARQANVPAYILPYNTPNPDYAAEMQRLANVADIKIHAIISQADRDKDQVMKAAQERTKAWEESVDNIKDEIEKPGSSMQLSPSSSGVYVKNFVNFGSDEDKPLGVNPLQAKALKLNPTSKKVESKPKPASN
jgi:hypothetical protein